MGFFIFVINSVALGVGLAMDAFSVSIAIGLREPKMKARRMCTIAGVYAVFQYAMPVIGWFCVHTAAKRFEACQKFIPWIALLLLACIGGKMLKEGIENVRDKRRAEELEEEEAELSGKGEVAPGELMLQGLATAIDALSVGFTIASYDALQANGSALIIGLVTFGICVVGLRFGKKFGEKLSDKSTIVGGLILIAIGLEIFLTGIFG